jgi:hypothetical protein
MLKKSRVLWITLMVLAIFFSHGCCKKSTKPKPPQYKWTILGYFDGNNSQDTSGTTSSYVIQDVQEMEQVGSSKDVPIVIMLGSIKTEGNCNYYLIEKYLNEPSDSISSKILDGLGKKDMSNPQTLNDFIKYGVEHFPAQHYLLILNDHGSGWRGICSDQQNGDQEMMSLPELSSFALSGYKFDIIFFNAPSMSMLEVAYQLKDKANYLVASQYKLPMQNVLGSSEWLKDLTDYPNLSSTSLANNIVDEIYHSADDKGKDIHIAVINLSRVDALASRVEDLGNSLEMKTGAYWNEVFDDWNAVHEQNCDDSAFTDLREFTRRLKTSANLDSAIINDALAVENATDYVVIKSLNNRYGDRGGLSIHLPWNSALFDSTDYVQLDFVSSNWHSFLSHFVASISGYLGGLRIVSYPIKGGRIFLNGQDTGLETDTTIHGLLPGSYSVKLVKTGCKDGNGQIFVVAKETKELRIPLLPGSPSKESISELQ